MNERAEPRLSTADLAAAGQERYDDVPGPGAGRRDALDGVDGTDVPGTHPTVADDATPLFSEDEGHRLRTRWEQIQTGFVDEPRHAVEKADVLVAETMKRLADVFSDERSELESQWTRGDDVSTEDLRIALRRYRSFFDRLLSV